MYLCKAQSERIVNLLAPTHGGLHRAVQKSSDLFCSRSLFAFSCQCGDIPPWQELWHPCQVSLVQYVGASQQWTRTPPQNITCLLETYSNSLEKNYLWFSLGGNRKLNFREETWNLCLQISAGSLFLSCGKEKKGCPGIASTLNSHINKHWF